MKEKLVIYWARRDLRIEDNPALTAACTYSTETGATFIPIFILEKYMLEGNPINQFGYPSRVFLSKALPLFAQEFKKFVLLKGTVIKNFISFSKDYDISIFVNEDVHPDFYAQIKKIRFSGVQIKLYSDALSIDKNTLTDKKNVYSIFTPFKKSVWQDFINKKPIKKCSFKNICFLEQSKIDLIKNQVVQEEKAILESFSQSKNIFVGGKIYEIDKLTKNSITFDMWYYSEKEAHTYFDNYLKEKMSEYKTIRDSLDLDGTSKMSPTLSWGLISSRILLKKIQNHFKNSFAEISALAESNYVGPYHYISELVWREFYKYIYFHNPQLQKQEFQEKYRNNILWNNGQTEHERFIAWIKGETGYPLVDAAMNQLSSTGWMHNRARMLVASVLTKNLGVDWRWGQEYFRAMLIDLDEASNNGGWQWAASVGADPKPIRIFNPYLQAENYDSKKIYQNNYLPKDYLENPPQPIVEHKEARNEALKRYGLKTNGPVRDF